MTTDGERHHIIDPRSGRCATSPWRTATVAAPRCVLANAWSTWALVDGDEAAYEMAQQGVAARPIDQSGTAVVVRPLAREAA
jgi:thiamine biosynthesis lipoprotein